MRTKRVQKIKALHVTQPNPIEDWKPPAYEFKGLEALQDREEEIINYSWYDYDRGIEREWEKLADESFDPDEWERELEARNEAQALAHGIDINVYCGCCCHEHTSATCEARKHYMCKSGLAYGDDPGGEGELDIYRKMLGLSWDEFF